MMRALPSFYANLGSTETLQNDRILVCHFQMILFGYPLGHRGDKMAIDLL
jgi:hypothetical protein